MNNIMKTGIKSESVCGNLAENRNQHYALQNQSDINNSPAAQTRIVAIA